MPSPTSLLAIFETFLEGHLRQEKQGKRFQVGVVQVCASLIKGALSVHKEVGLNLTNSIFVMLVVNSALTFQPIHCQYRIYRWPGRNITSHTSVLLEYACACVTPRPIVPYTPG